MEAALCRFTVLLQQNKADCVNGEIGEHMGQPGAIDGIQLFVRPVKNHTSDYQTCHNKQEEHRREPADHHCHMVQAEGCGDL